MTRLLAALVLAVWTVYVGVTGGLVALAPTACVGTLYAAWRLYDTYGRPDPTDAAVAAWQRQTDALRSRRR